jgi:O-antigen ligase
VVALIVFALLHSRRAAIAVGAALVILAVPLLLPSTQIGKGARNFADAVAKRDYQRAFSERLLPFLAAVEMTRDHPLLGVGPGCFQYHFMRYRLALPMRYPAALTQGWPMNWGEVHNDHLQVASETGLPGYALFLGALGVAAGIGSRRRAPAATAEAAFARALRWPLAAGVFVLCLAQFPMELAAPRLMLLSLGALCIGWDRDDAA